MTTLMAKIGLLAAAYAVQLANFWWTFGLWPLSWAAFFGFGFVSVVLVLVNTQIDKEIGKA